MLLDSNIIIYASNEDSPVLDDFLLTGGFSVSVITRIEVFGYHRITHKEIYFLKALFAKFTLLPLDDDVVDLAISIRQNQRMSLPDAVIAATALHHSLPLVTRNIADFRNILDLRIIDPFSV